MSGWKTVVAALVMGLLAIFSDSSMQQFFMDHFKAFGVLIPTIILVLRAVSNTSIFKDTSPAPDPTTKP